MAPNTATQSYRLLVLAVFTGIAEIIAVRFFAHRVFGSNISQIGFYSRDIYLPAFVAGTFITWVQIRHRGLELRLHRASLFAHLLTLSILVGCFFYFELRPIHLFPVVAVSTTLFLLALALVTFLSTFLNLRALLSLLTGKPRQLLLLLLAMGSLILYPKLVHANWFWLMRSTGYCVYSMMRFLGWKISLVDNYYAIELVHPSLNVSINMSCAGLEGIFFLLFAYCLLLFFLKNRCSLATCAQYAAVGILFMFAINILRIVTILSVSLTLYQFDIPGREFFSWAFHANIGWALYLFAIAAFIQRVRARLESSEHRASA